MASTTVAEFDLRAWVTNDHWLTEAGFWLGFAGLLLTVVGFWIAYLQLRKTRTALKSAEAASLQTRKVLRTADLRTSVISCVALGDELEKVRDLGRARLFIEDWRAAYVRVSALLSTSKWLPQLELGEAEMSLDVAASEVLLLRDTWQSRAALHSYDRSKLSFALLAFGVAAEALLLVADQKLLEVPIA